MVKFIKEPSEVNRETSVLVVKLIDAALSLTEQVTLCFIPFSEELSDMTASSSLNTLLLTLSWIMANAEV